jgi:alpha-amylase
MMYAFLFTIRGIPQIYYGSETGLEGYKILAELNNDYDLRRDFPWQLIAVNNEPLLNFKEESGLFQQSKNSLPSGRKVVRLNMGSSSRSGSTTLCMPSFDISGMKW